MPSPCGLITAGIALTGICDNPLINGVDEKLILINIDDIASDGRNATDNDIIESITMKTGKTGFAFEGQNHSLEPATRFIRGTYSTSFDHEIMFKIFDDRPAAKEQINKMVNGLFVAIVENNWQGDAGNASFTVYGINSGLEVAELEQIKSDSDTEGSYALVLRTPERSKEPRLPNSLFITDYATSKAVVDGLL